MIPLATPIENQSNKDKSTEPLQRKSVKVMLTNACSIISKLNELHERTESWLHPTENIYLQKNFATAMMAIIIF